MIEAKLRDTTKPSGKRAEAICPAKDWDGLRVSVYFMLDCEF